MRRNERAVQATFADLEPRVPARVASVAVALPVPHLLTYLVPAHIQVDLEPGLRVRVPVGPRRSIGFLIESHWEERPDPDLREITSTLETIPLLTPTTLSLGLWVAGYYGAGPGEALEALVPAAVRHGKHRREEFLVELTDTASAEAVSEKLASSPRTEAQGRIVAALLEAREPLRTKDVLTLAHVSFSPLRTLHKKGIVRWLRVEAEVDPFTKLHPDRSPPPELNQDQARALDVLLPRLEARTFSACLLHGVTGSGKTEVYLRLLVRALELGRSAILLVPEIALTPQTVERILSRVPEVAVLHSNLSEGDRAHHWHRLRAGKVRVAVGPRSAIFAPLPDVGLIVIDEEHESTFKQNNNPRYHARDVALERGRLEGALVVLGTATPSLELEAACRAGRLERLSLPRRVRDRPLPHVGIVDMRYEKPVGPGGLFSRPLVLAMEDVLKRGEQVVLFLNRRGFSTSILCRTCGWTAQCPHCDINLTHYLEREKILCHYCGHEKAPPRNCPECNSENLRYGGYGTERVERAARALFPHHRVARMDGETMRGRGAAEDLFNALRTKEIDILIGTQVLAKGFDVPNITLVGVISADTALLIPDFRSSERTFQLLCQVAGRAGRGHQPGRVFIQTYVPTHHAIQCAARHDHLRFVESELRDRTEQGYPPVGHLVRVVVESPDPIRSAEQAKAIGDQAQGWPEIRSQEVRVLGPAPCPLNILRGQHRNHLLFLSPESRLISEILPRLPRRSQANLRVLIDRDPTALL